MVYLENAETKVKDNIDAGKYISSQNQLLRAELLQTGMKVTAAVKNEKCVLIVDDDRILLASIWRAMRFACVTWTVYLAENFSQALDVLHESSVDVVVSDVAMPGHSGFDLLIRMQEEEGLRDIPVVFLTGLEESGLKNKALALGALDLMHKPLHYPDMFSRIDSLLRLKRRQDKLKLQNSSLADEKCVWIESLQLEVVMRLAQAAEYRDSATGKHLFRVASYCRILAETFGCDDEFVKQIYQASILHDLGKIGIPDSILLKEGMLTDCERTAMNQHCVLGADLLSEKLALAPGKGACFFAQNSALCEKAYPVGGGVLAVAREIAMLHHEHWDGSGYPLGISGEDIPLCARICAIADVYDALSTARPYREALPRHEVVVIMMQLFSCQFDPALQATFEACEADFFSIKTAFPY